jgi:hypothetical protein
MMRAARVLAVFMACLLSERLIAQQLSPLQQYWVRFGEADPEVDVWSLLDARADFLLYEVVVND